MYRTEEYSHLLDAERALHKALELVEPMERATIASALVRVIDQKRIMRMKPAPKAVDVSVPAKRKRNTQAPVAPMPAMPTTPTAQPGGPGPGPTPTTT